MLNCILLALSVSIDALSLGVTYGIKNSKISKFSNIIIFLIALVSTSLAMFLGILVSIVFSPKLGTTIGSVLLILLGIYIIYKVHSSNDDTNFDLDNSNSIDTKEAIILALTVSIDASCVGLSCGMMGFNSLLYPFLTAFFHMFFINCGNYFSKIIFSRINTSKKNLSILSGSILILIALIRLTI